MISILLKVDESAATNSLELNEAFVSEPANPHYAIPDWSEEWAHELQDLLFSILLDDRIFITIIVLDILLLLLISQTMVGIDMVTRELRIFVVIISSRLLFDIPTWRLMGQNDLFLAVLPSFSRECPRIGGSFGIEMTGNRHAGTRRGCHQIMIKSTLSAVSHESGYIKFQRVGKVAAPLEFPPSPLNKHQEFHL